MNHSYGPEIELDQGGQLFEGSASYDEENDNDEFCSASICESDSDPPRARRRLNDGMAVPSKDDIDSSAHSMHPDVLISDVLIDDMGTGDSTARPDIDDDAAIVSAALSLSGRTSESALSTVLSSDAVDGLEQLQHYQPLTPTLSVGERSRVGSDDGLESSSSASYGGAPRKRRRSYSNSRSVEEEHTIVLQRSCCSTSKSSNTKYQCKYCDFIFIGGPQKIRVHLTGRRENGTRLSRCINCPPQVKQMMESRMKVPKEQANNDGIYDDDDPQAPSLPRRNIEENHCVVLSRSPSSQSKSSNSRYKCNYCRFRFVGGPQKIRVHLTGISEGGTKVNKCTRAPSEVVEDMNRRRRTPPNEADGILSHTGTSTAAVGGPSRSTGSAGQAPTSQQVLSDEVFKILTSQMPVSAYAQEMYGTAPDSLGIHGGDRCYHPVRCVSSEPILYDPQSAEQKKTAQLLRMSSVPMLSVYSAEGGVSAPAQQTDEDDAAKSTVMQFPYQSLHALNSHHRQLLFPDRASLSSLPFLAAQYLPNSFQQLQQQQQQHHLYQQQLSHQHFLQQQQHQLLGDDNVAQHQFLQQYFAQRNSATEEILERMVETEDWIPETDRWLVEDTLVQGVTDPMMRLGNGSSSHLNGPASSAVEDFMRSARSMVQPAGFGIPREDDEGSA